MRFAGDVGSNMTGLGDPLGFRDAAMGGGAIFAQDKYTLKVPNGFAFSAFRGYEAWKLVSISQDGNLVAAILANPVMIKAYSAGVPGKWPTFP
jgi:hypothetical protein